MKKLMFAAIASLGLAGVAGLCDPVTPGPSPVVPEGCRVYDFCASVKMVDGKKGEEKEKGNLCVGSTTSDAYYRVKASRKFKGLFVECDPCLYKANNNVKTADALLSGEAAGGAMFYMATSDKKYKQVFSGTYWDGTPTKHYQFSILNWIGGKTFAKSKVAEGLVQIEFIEQDKFDEYRAYSILCAGFGSRDGDQLKNLSGNLAGAVTAANWCGLQTQCYEPCLETPYWTTTSTWDQGQANTWQGLEPKSPSYDAVSGTWSLKYNKSKSRLDDADTLFRKTFGSGYEMMVPGANKTVPVYPFAFAALQ
ncbi:MAG: hypothetical protein MJ249_00845 [Kiritimatiellae bacterium]|nr:hypothetical protein [Kiritimatiellia bacterium]